jgi:hypothetical protein
MSENIIIKTKTSPMATVSLIAGVLGFCFPIIGTITAIITGLLARKQIKESDGALDGLELALAGIGLAVFQILLITCAAGAAIVYTIALRPNLSPNF